MDCDSFCCAKNFRLDTKSFLGYDPYSTKERYNSIKLEEIETGQNWVLTNGDKFKEGGVTFYNFFMEDKFVQIPENMLTYRPEMTSNTDGTWSVNYNSMLCQSNTTMCNDFDFDDFED